MMFSSQVHTLRFVRKAVQDFERGTFARIRGSGFADTMDRRVEDRFADRGQRSRLDRDGFVVFGFRRQFRRGLRNRHTCTGDAGGEEEVFDHVITHRFVVSM